MTTYELRTEDGYSERFDAATEDAARDHALSVMADAEFDTSEGTVWYRGHLFEIETDDDGDERAENIAYLTYTFEPSEPDCERGQEHDWKAPHSVVGGIKDNPGVHGHGGGVIIREVCAHCGAYKVIDTWAQDMSNGQEGLHSVAYEDADEISLAWIKGQQLDQLAEDIRDATA